MRLEARALQAWRDVRASYWFVPSLLVVGGMALAMGMGFLDRNPDLVPFDLPEAWLDTQADGARVTLSVIAQSIIGIAGVMFSMTIVAVSFASGNFGPRLIGNFMRDRANQWSLGIMFATFAFSLIALRSVQSEAGEEILQFVPQYSIVMAMTLAGISLFTLIFFVHHIPESINVSRISASLGARLTKAVRQAIDRAEEADAPARAWPERAPEAVIDAPVAGYVEAVDLERMKEMAEENDLLIAVVAPPGVFVANGQTALQVWTPDPLTDKLRDDLRGCVAMGPRRTEAQNPSFLAEQLVEMIGRALSPGVNDPYTAIECLNWLMAACVEGTDYRGGLRNFRTGPIAVEELTFARLFEVSFSRSRQYIAPDDLARVAALRHMQRLLERARPGDRDLIETEMAELRAEAKKMGRPEGRPEI